MFFKSDLLKALGVIALLMPAAIADGMADGKADGSITLASAPVDSPTQAVGGHGRTVPVFFEPHSAALTPAAQRVLIKFAAGLMGSPDRRLTISGYAEAEETGRTGLAAERALAVHAFLVAQGFAEERLAETPVGDVEIPLVRVLNETPLERRAEIALR